MKLELKIEQIHKANLKSLGKLAFISDGIMVLKRLITNLTHVNPDADLSVVKDCSELDRKIVTLKKKMIRQDCNILSYLCTGKLVNDDRLNETKQSIQEVDQLNSRYMQLRKKLSTLLKKKK